MSNQLTHEDYLAIQEWDGKFGKALEALDKAKQLSVGDFLVLYIGHDPKSLKIQVNSYGAPVKYKVVHSSAQGIPFVKKVNKKGNPVGKLYSCTGGLSTDDYFDNYNNKAFEFRLDPDYADSIILADDYDPAALHRTKQEIFKEVTAHNKKYKVQTQGIDQCVAFFQTVNVGDMLWTSSTGHFLVQDKETVSRQDLRIKAPKVPAYTRVKGPFITLLTVVDKRGKITKITPDFFHWKALYTQRPRSYKELKI